MPSVLDIKAAVRERDKYRCTKCGMTAAEHSERYRKKLDVHRLVPGSVYTVEGSVTLCRSCHGPQPRRKKGQPDLAYPNRTNSDDELLRVRADLARKIQTMCAARSGSKRKQAVVDYLDAKLRDAVEADWEAFVKDLAADTSKPKPKKRKED